MSKHLYLKFVKLSNHKTQSLPNLINFHKIRQTPHFLISSNTCKAFNHSIHSGLYPDLLKIVKPILIFEKGEPTPLNNYRPISILNPINKIFENGLL